MIHLLDVNVLIALLDADHVFHDRAHRWFADNADAGWATCPMTQNALVRILGHNRYSKGPGSPAAVAELLRPWLARRDHLFWPDDLSLLASDHIETAALSASDQVTDTYLLALSVHHRGRLATFDRRISTAAVVGGAEALAVIA